MSEILKDFPDKGIVRLRINRAPVNAMTPDFLKKLKEELIDIENDPQIKTVILGSALNIFSAGVDLKQAVHFSKEDQRALVNGLNDFLITAYGFSKPLICEVKGPAIAGGFFLVLISDYIIAHEESSFALAEVKVGVPFPAGPMEIARHALSASALRRLMLSGAAITADKAQSMHIVDDVIADVDELEEVTLSKARYFAALPMQTYAHIKRDIRQECLEKIKTILAQGQDPAVEEWFNEETVTAMQAMLTPKTS